LKKNAAAKSLKEREKKFDAVKERLGQGKVIYQSPLILILPINKKFDGPVAKNRI